MTHLGLIVESLMNYNPANLVYTKLMTQVDDVANHSYALLDTMIQEVQHQNLSIRLHDPSNNIKSMQIPAQNSNWSLLIRNP